MTIMYNIIYIGIALIVTKDFYIICKSAQKSFKAKLFKSV